MRDTDVITHSTTTPLVVLCVKAEYLFSIPIQCFFFQWLVTVSSYRTRIEPVIGEGWTKKSGRNFASLLLEKYRLGIDI
jgi:hypothetical protein